jgi:hypothetical protein
VTNEDQNGCNDVDSSHSFDIEGAGIKQNDFGSTRGPEQPSQEARDLNFYVL